MSNKNIVNIEVRKGQKDNNLGLLRRFSRQIKESGIIRKVRKIRYQKRPKSKLGLKLSALKKIAKKKEIEHLRKLGKVNYKID
ncbi:hypothetical protein A2995_02020 [Candidatus Nomurabacteria bacterium RIFCSPLOWO2_01_FULL_33_24]|uniref:30S ribosomal protein S21 n=1 Tax=Candidatus Nomurabacteria bacterium RIFCSPLOWO2_01_FULL_33_24 TaxID=1801765 RepID=A0A1F6WZ46_9BACT|nr:MAG: hypothetical protein A2995_02020 [Candidatus Nomurabacteria bacterium RIFCSPLOWO2_01_FULL_33_24]